MVCIQVYFEIPYAPYTRKTLFFFFFFFFHKGSSELSVINVYVQGNEGGKQIHHHSEIFFSLNTSAVVFGCSSADSLLSGRFFLGSYCSSQWSQCRNVRLLGKQKEKRNENVPCARSRPRLQKKKKKNEGEEGKERRKKKS